MSSRIAFIARILIITLLLFAGYYLIFLGPKLKLPRSLLAAEQKIAKHYFNLVQNRLALLSIERLNPKSGRFPLQVERTLTTLSQTNDLGLKEIEKEEPIKNLGEISNEFPLLLNENKAILISQKTLIEKLAKYASAVKNIYEYLPERDLGYLDISQRDELIKRSDSAISGLEKIKTDLEGLDFEKERIDRVQDQITRSQEKLRILSSSPTVAKRDSAVEELTKLKEVALQTQKQFLKSDEGISLITRQTNLIFKYSFMFEKINQMQKDLKL